MNKEEKKIFLKLVAEGAQTKAYRQVGIDKFSIKEHLGRIAEYQRDVAERDVTERDVAERDVAEPEEISIEALMQLIEEESATELESDDA